MNQKRIEDIQKKINEGARVSDEEALVLLREAELLSLGQMAQTCLCRFHTPKRVTFLIDRNINYTNICTILRAHWTTFTSWITTVLRLVWDI